MISLIIKDCNDSYRFEIGHIYLCITKKTLEIPDFSVKNQENLKILIKKHLCIRENLLV